MATERSLAALLRSLHATAEPYDAFALLPTATSLLSALTNPLNITLLASQLLFAPAIWDHDVDLQTCRRIISVFNTAAYAVMQNDGVEEPFILHGRQKKIEREGWVKAVVNGADGKSPRWRHLLLIGGILIGFEGQNRQGLPSNIQSKLESALVTAAQMALDEIDPASPGIEGYCVTMVLNYTFGLLSDLERTRLDYDRLLPILVQAAFSSSEGLEGGYFLGAIDNDIVEAPGKKFQWPAESPTYARVTAMSSSPLVSSLGPLSRLIAHALESVHNSRLISQTVDSVADFVRTLMVQWRLNKLSEVDVSEEIEFLDVESIQTTLPVLWKMLRNSLYSIVILLRAVLGRVINDHMLASDAVAPYLCMQTLHILRGVHFISSRVAQNASSQHLFVTLAAVDILSQYPDLAENLLRSIKPSEMGQIPGHPLERCLDSFFLNTAEHFTPVLSEVANEELLISAATPYLAAGGHPHLLEIFEAAHSVVLSVFATPQNADITAKHLPFYVETLFTVFPHNLSARQFRLAFKTVMQVTAPPSPLANNQPLLPSILLETLHERARSASTSLLPPSPNAAAQTQVQASSSPSSSLSSDPTTIAALTEQAVLVLALIDSLCFLRVPDLQEWLPLAAQLIHLIPTAADSGTVPDMRALCIDRFWEGLSGGEMDVERAHFCVTWWCTGGGRELLLYGPSDPDHLQPGLGHADPDPDGLYMTGAVDPAPETKL
ncbi:hypothetical protein ASPZODRAFT_126405 [Penicilliopsis zonata CBS 506.65]|uniref:Peroxisomal membrane protein PEX17 n=1 Tax=Penicilliopsis zonata CBS 506.65 TaxID=1073090 RepID=A0A1L9STV2_9EURO|nr:hypothetical protein ASPZODRAFT_126405 [Penicilliopsis zonata CBS 506.65]OJJ50517.1 hypothetical protein ASPZODRAFT_126405 [Penicilliopsis zonata CBS 506.65]